MTYTNPILCIDYSDPDVIRVGSDYFMVASSFANTPAVPILHSTDLVEWEIIGYVAERLPFSYYDFPMHGCGTWAPSLRYHKGTFFCFVPYPDEGIFVYRTDDIYGEWSEPVHLIKSAGWIDPCPLFDDDGKVYMVNAFAKSRIGFKSMLHVCELSADCTEVVDEGHFVFDGTLTEPTIEGPKFYKRNGYYYIMAPSGGVKNGWQVALRSNNVYGPYEIRTVMAQGTTNINGPHQGGWVDTEDGEDWFIHFQDVENAGRIIHLQPMKWEEDWPIIGKPVAGEAYGEPVTEYAKPRCRTTLPVRRKGVSTGNCSEIIIDGRINPNWQWNGNSNPNWYSVNAGKLRLNSINLAKEAEEYKKKFAAIYEFGGRGEDFRFALNSDKSLLCNQPNLLTLKLVSRTPQMSVTVDLGNMFTGDETGAGVLGDCYSSFVVKKTYDGYEIGTLSGSRLKEEERIANVRRLLDDAEKITIKVLFIDEKHVKYSFSVDSTEETLEETFDVTPGRWVGAKLFVFARSAYENSKGCVTIENIDITEV